MLLTFACALLLGPVIALFIAPPSSIVDEYAARREEMIRRNS